MNLTINDTDIDIPFDPSVIPLHMFLEFQVMYGNDIELQMRELLKEFESNGNEEHATQLNEEIELLIDNEALAWFTYWSGFNFFDFDEQKSLVTLLAQYRLLREMLKNPNQEIDFPYSTEWNGEQWTLQNFVINPESEITFNEVITSKEVMRQLSQLEGGRWLSLKYLSAIFFRKKSEAFTDNLVFENGQRLQIMDNLPLSFGLTAAFFLTSSMSFLKKPLVYLGNQEVILNLN